MVETSHGFAALGLSNGAACRELTGKLIKGPIGALIGYLKDYGINAPTMELWQFPEVEGGSCQEW